MAELPSRQVPTADFQSVSPLYHREWEEGRAKHIAGLRLSDAPFSDYVERALDNLVRWGEVTNSPYNLETWVIWTARKSYRKGREMALLELRTSPEVADELGVHPATIFRWARKHEIGWHIGGITLFTREDVDRMRALRR